MSESFANPRVLNFYRQLAFNAVESPESMAEEIRGNNVLHEYPPLREILGPSANVVDMGCGTGWFANSIAHHARVFVTGIDFNSRN